MTADFISEEMISDAKIYGEKNKLNINLINEILEKARDLKGLNYLEVSVLLNACEDGNDGLRDKIFSLARNIKERIYGKRIVMFAPLYVSNYCVNNCKYCGYHSGSDIMRKKLTQAQVEEETLAIIEMGHKRIALEAGEDYANCPVDYILECMKTIYSVKSGHGEIRRINVNIAATETENYRKLKAAGIGTYILFQETYNREVYKKLHGNGPKSDYDYHTTAHDRAMLGGIDDVGIGVLYGLYEYKYEVIATMLHIAHLEKTFGIGPHTISLPRLRAASNVDLSEYPHIVTDEQFKNIVAVLRIAVPYTGMIISTRESQDFRDEIVSLGISQASGGSCTGVGEYSGGGGKSTAQFKVSDERSQADVTKALLKNGYIPSFCTACYREGRTGDRFMQLAKTGDIANCCLPNAMLTLAEYALDYGDDEFKRLTYNVIRQERENILNTDAKDKFDRYLADLEAGRRDLRF